MPERMRLRWRWGSWLPVGDRKWKDEVARLSTSKTRTGITGYWDKERDDWEYCLEDYPGLVWGGTIDSENVGIGNRSVF